MLYAIGDIHLSNSVEKNMDVFGSNWSDYMQKLAHNWQKTVKENDIVVLCGDISWAMNFEELYKDLLYLENLPGKKILLKGNHDYWWNTKTKMTNFFKENNLNSFEILFNNSFIYENIAICGFKGHTFDDALSKEQNEKIMNRECLRLKASLDSAKHSGCKYSYVFTHYPPKLVEFENTVILDIIAAYGVRKVYYGHLHSAGIASAFNGIYNITEFRLISADSIDFTPYKVI